MKAAYLSFLFLFFNQILLAGHQIRGVVKDVNDASLFGVNIYIKDTYDGASSDANGNFQFETDKEGSRTLIASFIGFKTFEFGINITEDFIIEIILEEEINKIDGITISAGAFEAGDKKKSVVLRTFDVVTTAGATADITGVMNTLPGTQTVGEEGRLFVRGGAGHETRTFINGLLVAEPYGVTPQNVPSRFRFSPFLFKGAFFSTGGYSAEYGQALSSVLQLNTYDLPARSQTDISVMSVGADVSQTIRRNNTSLYGQVQYTDLTAYYAIVPQKDEWNRAPHSLNSTFHFKQKFGETGSVQAYTNFNRSGMVLYQPSPEDFNQQSRYDITASNLYSNVAINDALGESVSYRGGLSYSLNSNHVKMEEGQVTTNTNSIHAKLAFDHDISENLQLKYGGEWIFDEFEEDMREYESSQLYIGSFSNHLISPFAEADVYFSNNLVARIGARYEYNSLFESQVVSPRASLAYKLRKSSQISLAYGKFSQLPLRDYLKWTDKLNSEKATHYILNYQYSKEGRIFRSEMYYKTYDKLVTKTGTGGSETDLENDGYGEARGVEFFWRDSKTFEYIDYWISYSYLDTKRKYDVFPYPVMPYYASNHNLSVVYKHFISSLKSQIGGTYSFASGRPYTDPNTDRLNGEKTKNYHDLSLNYSYLFKPNMILHVSVSNVLGFSNVFGYQYNSRPSEDGIYESMPIEPQAKRFMFVGFFITMSKDKNANQLNNL
jgi:hypothetical protein